MHRILIIDDEYYIRQMLRAAIRWEDIGYEIVGEAEDGLSALREIERTRPDVVLVDINIPKLFGLELIERITEEYPTVSVVILSAYDKFSYAQQAVRMGVFDYLLKPIDPEAIAQTFVRLQSRIEQNRLQSGVEAARAAGSEDPLSKRIRASILENFRDPDFSPATLAEMLHVNPNHMSRVYRQETGGTIIEELIDTRMGEARRLMDSSPAMPVCEAARLCGYADPLYFSKAFKKKFGVSPQKIKNIKKGRVFFP